MLIYAVFFCLSVSGSGECSMMTETFSSAEICEQQRLVRFSHTISKLKPGQGMRCMSRRVETWN